MLDQNSICVQLHLRTRHWNHCAKSTGHTLHKISHNLPNWFNHETKHEINMVTEAIFSPHLSLPRLELRPRKLSKLNNFNYNLTIIGKIGKQFSDISPGGSAARVVTFSGICFPRHELLSRDLDGNRSASAGWFQTWKTGRFAPAPPSLIAAWSRRKSTGKVKIQFIFIHYSHGRTRAGVRPSW